MNGSWFDWLFCSRLRRMVFNALSVQKRFPSNLLIFLSIGMLAGCSKTEQTSFKDTSVAPAPRLVITVGKSIRKAAEFEMEGPLADSDFRGELKADKNTVQMVAGSLSEITIPLKLRNLSTVRWSSVGEEGGLTKLAIGVGYHLYDKGGQLIMWEGKRTPLPTAVGPNETLSISALVRAPSTPGEYVYVFDLVQEGVAWFGGKGSPTLSVGATAF